MMRTAPHTDDVQISRSHLIAARNLLEQAASHLRQAKAWHWPDCMETEHTLSRRVVGAAEQVAMGLEEIEERLEGTHA